ncbi:MAG: glycosyltransferase family 2 protein [Fusobacteriaceae bacterium]
MDKNIDYFEYVDNFATYSDVKSILLYGDENNKSYKVSIAIPTYKRVELLKESLESALAQESFHDYDIIVVDNDDDFKSTECLELIKSFGSEKIKYYKNQKNIGMFGNWNRCIELSTGEYLTILNDDDWFEKDYLFEMMKNLKSKDAIICSYFKRDLRIDKDNLCEIKKIEKKISLKNTSIFSKKDIFWGNVAPGSLGIVFKKENLISIGGYNPAYYPTSDYILTSNYISKFECIRLKNLLVNYRIQENESLKKETLISFIENDFKFRNFLIEKKIVPKFYKLFLKIIKNNQIKYYTEFSNISIPIVKEEVKKIDKIFFWLYLKKEKLIKIIKIGIKITL